MEMELAGVQAISDFYGFELYDFLVAGDVLIEGNYETDGLSAANHDLDKLFLALIHEPETPFFSMKLQYAGDTLVYAALNGKELAV